MAIRIVVGMCVLLCAAAASAADDMSDGEALSKLPTEAIKAQAKQGKLLPIHALCYRYIYGDQAPLDYAEAHSWCAQGAVRGEPNCQTLLAELFLLGRGGATDHERAYYWYSEAAAQDHQHALYMLYWMDADGVSPEKDPERAMGYLRRAAELGHERAIDQLKALENKTTPGKMLRKNMRGKG